MATGHVEAYLRYLILGAAVSGIWDHKFWWLLLCSCILGVLFVDGDAINKSATI